MNINWMRLLITIGIVMISSALLGYLMWTGMTNVIKIQEDEIQSLQTRSTKLSEQYFVKLQEKKAKEEAKSATTTTPKASNTSTEATETATDEASNSPEPTPQSQILYFYNPSCGACIAQEPIVLQLQSEGIPFAFMNVVETPSYIGQYGITFTPTFILNGHRTGYSSKAQLQTFWNTYK